MSFDLFGNAGTTLLTSRYSVPQFYLYKRPFFIFGAPQLFVYFLVLVFTNSQVFGEYGFLHFLCKHESALTLSWSERIVIFFGRAIFLMAPVRYLYGTSTGMYGTLSYSDNFVLGRIKLRRDFTVFRNRQYNNSIQHKT